MPDADVIVGNAPFLHKFFSLRTREDFFRAMNPAGAKSDGVGAEHHIPNSQRAVFQISRAIRIGKHDNNRGRAVERIGIDAQNFRVPFRKKIARLFILNDDELRRLHTPSGRGVGARFKNGV